MASQQDDTSETLLDQAKNALFALERACEALSAKRSRDTYHSMIDNDGALDQLLELDRCRLNARSLLDELGVSTGPTAASERSVEVQRMMVCSTGHVTQATVSDLDNSKFYARVGEHGWCVPVLRRAEAPEHYASLPADLVAIMDRATAEGCTFVMLDSDASAIDGLEVFEPADLHPIMD